MSITFAQHIDITFAQHIDITFAQHIDKLLLNILRFRGGCGWGDFQKKRKNISRHKKRPPASLPMAKK